MVKKIIKFDVLMLYTKDYGRKYYLRELAHNLNKPHQTIKPYVETLVAENILIKTERKKITEYSLNLKDTKVCDYLVIAEKQKLISLLNKNMLIKTLFDKLSPFFNKNTFLIFGSLAADSPKASDIDMIIIGKSNVAKTLEEFEEVYSKKVHRIQLGSFKKLSPELAIEIYKKHIILNNTETIIRHFCELYKKNKLV